MTECLGRIGGNVNCAGTVGIATAVNQAKPSPLQVEQRFVLLPKHPEQLAYCGLPNLSLPAMVRPDPPQIWQGARPDP